MVLSSWRTGISCLAPIVYRYIFNFLSNLQREMLDSHINSILPILINFELLFPPTLFLRVLLSTKIFSMSVLIYLNWLPFTLSICTWFLKSLVWNYFQKSSWSNLISSLPHCCRLQAVYSLITVKNFVIMYTCCF